MTHEEFTARVKLIGEIHQQLILEAKTEQEKMNIFQEQILAEQALLNAYMEGKNYAN